MRREPSRGESSRTRRLVAMTLVAVLIQALVSLAWVSPLSFRVMVAGAQRVFGGSIGEASVLADVRAYFEYADACLAGRVPYRDFLVEYPIGAMPLFLAPRLFARTFEGYRWAFAFQMVPFLVWLNWSVARHTAGSEGAERVAGRLAWLTLALAPLGVLVFARFDLAPTALAFAAVLAWSGDRPAVGGALAGLGTLVKLFPAAAALPCIMGERAGPPRWLSRGPLALAATIAAGGLAWTALGGRGVPDALAYHAGRGLEIESVWSGLLMMAARAADAPLAHDFNHHSAQLIAPGAGLAAQLAGPATLAGLALLVLRARQADRREWPRLAGAAVLVFAALGKVLSPQYLIWPLPFVAVVPGRTGRWARGLGLACTAATSLVYPLGAVALVQFEWPAILILNLRNALVLGLLAVLLIGLPERRG